MNSPRSIPPQISAKSIGLLFLIIVRNLNISAESLAVEVQEGRSAVLSGLRELRTKGYIKTVRNKTSAGVIMTQSEVTTEGYIFFNQYFLDLDLASDHCLNLGFLLPQGTSRSFIDFLPHREFSRDQAISPTTSASGVSSQPKRKRSFIPRDTKPMNKWTPTDVSFEFGDRVAAYWDIYPWQVSKTRFTKILKSFRDRYKTNGEIEFRMMDRFFESERIDSLTTGDFLLSRFFLRFQGLLRHDILSEVTPEDIAKAEALSDKQWGNIGDT